MELELRHLRMITTVCESGSVTKAAAVLGLSQPALTAQLNRIDRTLGGPVFVRDRHGTRATPLGELVLRHARVVLPAMDVLLDDARRQVNRTTWGPRSLRLGTVSTPLGGLFANQVRTALHDVTVTPSTSWSVAGTTSRLAGGELDVALVGVCADSAPPPDGHVVWRHVATDPVFVMVDAHHRHATRLSAPLTDLGGETWLNAPGDGCFERCFVSACVRAGFTPRSLGESERTAAIDQVRAGHAVALVQPVMPVAPGVRVLALDGSPLRWSHYVGWRQDVADRVDVGQVARAARCAHDDAVRRSPAYLRWLTTHQIDLHNEAV
ncbi:LysR family transcriptional regulator [Cellulomonas bogoriensis]|uniref:LysR family transcriptional regulator n=1 Tax=Cellulomonas bogoriensis 69B4 = DSM 16987 TaxID=1386082 RepID=A0A0A0BZ57_9CELL|nr:LysR family transcriptional regulator [Cellulomonas bogoriensis]KGM13678.1 LysR family transcriptional regulator [Cellulomonas bogoriensis 69B4 = DSM 16987]